MKYTSRTHLEADDEGKEKRRRVTMFLHTETPSDISDEINPPICDRQEFTTVSEEQCINPPSANNVGNSYNIYPLSYLYCSKMSPIPIVMLENLYLHCLKMSPIATLENQWFSFATDINCITDSEDCSAGDLIGEFLLDDEERELFEFLALSSPSSAFPSLFEEFE